MAYFSADGDEFPVDEVTNALGIAPASIHTKGEAIPDNPQLVSTKIRHRKQTDWTLSTGYEESYDINNQLNVILKSLKGKTEQLNHLSERYNLEFLFMVVIQVENNESPAMYLQKDMIDFASSIQAEIHFDLYIFS
ncbi:DUF4279 domain-containing protein [Bacillus sp. FJAT-42376]|uniref:DUF4279 domain-containing protein n=1 Tax=Bacillus sp. FJAT-42376 TaxID=2014076 RepID=UPI000F4E76DF|nr:DUF4279 domain-containing protein [Bacillus sp. FJAT-42376]AZB44844.1 DUF4279 domain-containing protein [Bacillus sp. FJAT-42376]